MCGCTPLYLEHRVSVATLMRSQMKQMKQTESARVRLSHRDAHTGEHAVRICRHYLQPLRDQSRAAVEERFEVNELLLETVVVRLEVAQARPFCSRIIVVISAGRAGETHFDRRTIGRHSHDAAYRLKQVTQPKDSGSTTVFNTEELCMPCRLHSLFTMLQLPSTRSKSTSACCPNNPMCVMACNSCIRTSAHSFPVK